jgi:hypothetical protein
MGPAAKAAVPLLIDLSQNDEFSTVREAAAEAFKKIAPKPAPRPK